MLTLVIYLTKFVAALMADFSGLKERNIDTREIMPSKVTSHMVTEEVTAADGNKHRGRCDGRRVAAAAAVAVAQVTAFRSRGV